MTEEARAIEELPHSHIPLRLLLVTDGITIPAWLLKSLETVLQSGAATGVLVLRTVPQPRRWSNVLQRSRDLLFRLYNSVDHHLFRTSPDAHTATDLHSAFPDCRTVDGTAVAGTPEVDVALDPFCLLPDRWLADSPRYGVWSLQFGQSGDRKTQSSPAFWEVVEGRPTTETRLCVRREGSTDTLSLYVSVAPTDRRSVSRSQNHVWWKLSAALARKLQELSDDPEAFFEKLKTGASFAVARDASATPGNLDMLRAGTRLLRRYVADKWTSRLYREQWALAYRREAAAGSPPEPFHQLIPPSDRFWADPFPVRVGNDYYLFHEELRHSTGKGTIVLTVMDDAGRTAPPIPILEREYHLSYPCVFEWDGELFMMPETAAVRRIELYRCVKFPTQWTLEHVVLRGLKALDPTPAFLFGTWWLFANTPAAGVAHSLDELHLFHADSPLGPWTRHPASPVKSDVRSARPAGRIFERQGQYFRPAQDCSTRYGSAVVINRILRLDHETYEEVEAEKVGLDGGARVEGAHTFNAAGNITVIDCLLRRRRLGIHGAAAT